MPLFVKNVVHFEVFTNEMECGKQDFSTRNKVIVLNGTNVLIFPYKNARKMSFIKYNTSIHTVGQKNLCTEEKTCKL